MEQKVPDIKHIESMKHHYCKVFNTEEGKIVLSDLNRKCFITATTLNNEPHVMAFNEGQRVVLLHINTMLNVDIEMLRKSQEKKENLPNG